jgi:hypothetical protein
VLASRQLEFAHDAERSGIYQYVQPEETCVSVGCALDCSARFHDQMTLVYRLSQDVHQNMNVHHIYRSTPTEMYVEM